MARAKTPGIYRPPCPRGHEGSIQLDGRALTKDRLFERTRFRCVPNDRGEKEHVYRGQMPSRRAGVGHNPECPHCERPFHRAEGLAGGWRFRFVVREIALALKRVGQGQTYRIISRDMRKIINRKSTRGRLKGFTSKDAHLAINYIDSFAKVVTDALLPDEWPPIVLLDAHPIRIRDHSLCCAPYRAAGKRPPRHPDTWGPPEDEDDGNGGRRPKISHAAPIKEIGRILVAVGLKHAGDPEPEPVLIRFAGGGDQASWAEFLRALPGQPEWVVSDRDQAISGAVKEVWGDDEGTTHYFCEQHIAKNGAEKASLDGIQRNEHREFWQIFEHAQWGPAEWARLEGAAQVLRAPRLRRWLRDTGPLMQEQWRKRRQFYPRSAGACEATIAQVARTIQDREMYFLNADRFNLLLGLATLEYKGQAAEAVYSKLIREIFLANDGRSPGDWFEMRDPAGMSSMRELESDAAIRAKGAKTTRQAPKKAAYHREKRAEYEQELRILGAKPSPRGRPRLLRAQGSVAGKTIADFGWLVAEFHGTLNGDRQPKDVPAGGGDMIWWRCFEGPDHIWQAQTRSRAMRGSGCPFCAHKKVARSESLEVAYPDVAAQWHPTRNGDKTPADVSFGSKVEAWWQCPTYKSHVWRARIASRTAMLAGCSLCAALKRPGGTRRADAEAHAIA